MNLRYLQLIFGIGFGACAGFIAGKLYYERKAEDRADKEIDDVKHYYLEKSLEGKVDKNVSVVTPAMVYQPDNVKPTETEPEKPKKKKRKKSKTNYSDISKESEDKDLKEHMEDIVKTEHPEDDPPTEPYEISDTEFLEENQDYDKFNYSYYEEDEALVDEANELVDISNSIGSDLMNKFVTEDYTTMFVRNDKTSSDYEIDLVYGSVKDQIGLV